MFYMYRSSATIEGQVARLKPFDQSILQRCSAGNKKSDRTIISPLNELHRYSIVDSNRISF